MAQVAVVAEVLEIVLNPPDPNLFRYIEQVSKEIQALARTVAPHLAAIDAARRSLEMQAAVAVPAIQAMAARTQEFAREFLVIVEGLRRWHEHNARVLVLLAPRGWLLSPHLTIGVTTDLLALYDGEGIEAVDDAMLAGFDDEDCAVLLNDLCESPVFSDWRGTLSKAFEAHRRGEYELAIPIWLIAIDGVCRRELNGVDVYGLQSATGKRADEVRRQILDRMGASAARLYEDLRDPEINALMVVFTGMGGKGDPVVLNRNAVLHGDRPLIGDRRDSVQAIVVLDVLQWLLTLRSAQKPPES